MNMAHNLIGEPVSTSPDHALFSASAAAKALAKRRLIAILSLPSTPSGESLEASSSVLPHRA
jgi:hypothetical protein